MSIPPKCDKFMTKHPSASSEGHWGVSQDSRRLHQLLLGLKPATVRVRLNCLLLGRG